jgi:formylglycine-generating enzyme required for sulfatase activity
MTDKIVIPKCAENNGIDEYGVYFDFFVKNVIQRMRYIPAGRFMMGLSIGEQERFDDELQHEVEITKGFWLADTACTQALWEIVMDNNPSEFKGKNNPAESVSWYDCIKFIKKINSLKPGLNLRLPTEAEWEYACRGTKCRNNMNKEDSDTFFFGKNITTDQVNYNGNYPYNNGQKGEFRGKTIPVKSLPYNDYGLYEMHGNVWEWCADWYGGYSAGRVVDPVGIDKGTSRVLRGGSWIGSGGVCRSACRNRLKPDDYSGSIGLRLARSVD